MAGTGLVLRRLTGIGACRTLELARHCNARPSITSCEAARGRFAVRYRASGWWPAQKKGVRSSGNARPQAHGLCNCEPRLPRVVCRGKRTCDAAKQALPGDGLGALAQTDRRQYGGMDQSLPGAMPWRGTTPTGRRPRKARNGGERRPARRGTRSSGLLAMCALRGLRRQMPAEPAGGCGETLIVIADEACGDLNRANRPRRPNRPRSPSRCCCPNCRRQSMKSRLIRCLWAGPTIHCRHNSGPTLTRRHPGPRCPGPRCPGRHSRNRPARTRPRDCRRMLHHRHLGCRRTDS